MPVYQLLGGKCREGAAVYVHADGRDPQEVTENVRKFMAQGYRYVRVQMGGYGGKGAMMVKPEGAPERLTRNDALFPPHGNTFGAEGRAGCGLGLVAHGSSAARGPASAGPRPAGVRQILREWRGGWVLAENQHGAVAGGDASRQLDQELGRAPSAREIAKKLKLSEEEVEDTMHIANTHVSLDDPYSTDQDDTSLVDYLQDDSSPMPDEETYGRALSDDMEKALATLSERERQILSMYFGLNQEEPLTLEEIGKELGLTRERIRQIKEKAIGITRSNL